MTMPEQTPLPSVSSNEFEQLFNAFSRLQIEPASASNTALDGESPNISASLNSLPVEILQTIMNMVLNDDVSKSRNPIVSLKRVLVLQSICVYVRDVIRGTPEFWTSLSSSKPDMFDVQLERSKGLLLSLDLYVPHLTKDDKRVTEVFQRCAGQWRSLHVLIPGVAYTMYFAEDMGTLNFDKVEEVYLNFQRPPPDEPGMGYAPYTSYHLSIFDYLAKRMPNMKHLTMRNRQPTASIATNMTSFTYDHDKHSEIVYGLMLQFVNTQPLLKSLSFPMRDGKVTFMNTYPATLGNRDIEFNITVDGLFPNYKFDPIFSTFKRVGITRLNWDFMEAPNQPKCNVFFCHLLGLLSGEHALVELRELSFALPSYISLPCTSACVESNSKQAHKLPQSLQALRIYNASHTVVNVMGKLVENLVCSQKAAGVPPLEIFEVTEAR